MLVLFRRCAEKVVIGNNIVVSVVDIREDRVRLAVAPLFDQTIDLQEEGTANAIVPEVQRTETGYQVLVWAERGCGFRVNESAGVRILAVEGDRVRLGIVALREAGGREESAVLPAVRFCVEVPGEPPLSRGELNARDPGAAPVRVSPEVLSDWLAQKIAAYLRGKPRGTLQDLARRLNVRPISINRWKKRQTNISTEHLDGLFTALNIGLGDLADYLNVAIDRLVLPEVKSRGPAKADAAPRH